MGPRATSWTSPFTVAEGPTLKMSLVSKSETTTYTTNNAGSQSRAPNARKRFRCAIVSTTKRRTGAM